MTNHALERIFERYGRELTFWDINNLIKTIKQGKCLVLDDSVKDSQIILLSYNHLPLKLVYSPGFHHKGYIVTALPFDVDEWNEHISEIPEVFYERKKTD